MLSYPAVNMKIEALFGGLTTLVLSIIGWAFSINSKVSAGQQAQTDVKDLLYAQRDLMEVQFNAVMTKFDDMDTRLDRVERHVLNGHYGDR